MSRNILHRSVQFDTLEGRMMFCAAPSFGGCGNWQAPCWPAPCWQNQNHSSGGCNNNGGGCNNGGGKLISGASLACDFTNTLDEFGVLGAGNSNVCISGPNTQIGGNVGLGKCTTGSFANCEIYKNLELDPSANVVYQNKLQLDQQTITKSLGTVDAITVDASTRAAGLTPTQTLCDIHGSTTINLTAGVNVINVNSINLHCGATLTLNGCSSAVVIINVAGGFNMDNASIQLTGGLTEPHVLWNVVGCGPAVTICNNSTQFGEILAPNRDILVDNSTANGAVIGAINHNICIHNSFVQVGAPHFQAPAGI